jgi:peptidoglycan-associated lipoprotein
MVNVTVPPPPPTPAPAAKSLAERVDTELADAYFDYDKSDIRDDAQAALTADANALRSILADFPDAVLYLEGHCDERGSAEYNLALGDRRTIAASVFLEALGLNTNRLQRISAGKEKPQCAEATEECWQRNRRVHFSASEDVSQGERNTADASGGETKGTGVLPGPSF